MGASIFLGYEVGTGEPVYLPLHHMIVTGLTRLSGKTTTAEAIMTRLPQGFRALAFRTKRGELSFHGANRTQPYFVQKTDWEYVQALLEAAMKERLRFERSWIIKATKGTKTLREVYDNILQELHGGKRLRGLDESIWTNLAAYFEKVLPQLEENPFAQHLELELGPNVMDLGHLSEEVQALVIASCLEEVWKRGKDTLVVIPESWKFIPQQRGNPVKWAAQHVIREGGAVGVYQLLDSQDVAGVDKAVLKSCDNWLIGRQREQNEVQRVLDQLPLPRVQRPRPEQIMRLPVGHFYVASGDWCKQVYVVPTWLSSEEGRLVALGEAPVPQPPVESPQDQEDLMWKERAEELEKELNGLKAAYQLSEMASRAETDRVQELEARLGEVQGQLKALEARDIELEALKLRATEYASFRTAVNDFRRGWRGLVGDADQPTEALLGINHAELIENVTERVLHEVALRESTRIVHLMPLPALEEILKGRAQEGLMKRTQALIAEAEALTGRQKEMLAALVSSPQPLTIMEVTRRLGVDIRSSGAARETWGKAMGGLVREQWVYRHATKKGFKERVRLKVQYELAYWKPAAEETDLAVERILAVLARGVGAQAPLAVG